MDRCSNGHLKHDDNCYSCRLLTAKDHSSCCLKWHMTRQQHELDCVEHDVQTCPAYTCMILRARQAREQEDIPSF